MYFRVFLGLICAGLISLTVTPIVRVFAYKIGAVDVPKDNRRMHKKPMPLLGGLAIFLGFLLAVLWRVRRDVFSVLLCFITAWFGIFFNIMEVQICTLPLWSLLALRQDEPRGIGDMQAFNP